MIYLRSLVALVDLAAALANVALDTLAAHVADPSTDGETPDYTDLHAAEFAREIDARLDDVIAEWSNA